MPQMTVNEAIGLALAEEMRKDSRVLMFGEGVATKRPELLREFGALRVRNTPLSEGIIAGTAVGAAATGLRPVVDLLFAPFLCYAMEEIVNSPGLKVVMPATPADFRGLLKAAIRDENPVMFFGDMTLGDKKGEVAQTED